MRWKAWLLALCLGATAASTWAAAPAAWAW